MSDADERSAALAHAFRAYVAAQLAYDTALAHAQAPHDRHPEDGKTANAVATAEEAAYDLLISADLALRAARLAALDAANPDEASNGAAARVKP